MGSCLCKKSKERSSQNRRRTQEASTHETREERFDVVNSRIVNPSPHELLAIGNFSRIEIVQLIVETLSVIRDLVNNDQEPPSSLLRLNVYADKEDGWQMIVKCLIDTIPAEDALGPAVITLFLDESPLPTRETVSRLIDRLGLSPHSTYEWWQDRNICIVLGSLAERMAGASSASLCGPSTLLYLLNNLSPKKHPEVILFSLIALEKFAQTTENRLMIMRSMNDHNQMPLEVLEEWKDDRLKMEDCIKRQVTFCAQWSLDNIFVNEMRTFSCMITDVSNINAMLNHSDVSQYLKIGPDGLQARCDVSSFESVRCTFEVQQDGKSVWYYEATVLTAGVMQIGLATKKSRYLNHEGYGIGDDEHSIAYDGCRQLVWHAAKGVKHCHKVWKAGDTVGCLLDLRNKYITFSLNGQLLGAHKDFFSRISPSDGIFAAASFMSFQHCIFNFGASPFRFPPCTPYLSFNRDGGAKLSQEEKTILPRSHRLECLSRHKTCDNACTICCENVADTLTLPCMHGGMCERCALQVENCPFCRVTIERRIPTSSVPGAEVDTIKIHSSV